MKNTLLGVYAVKHKNIDIRMKSRSGGIFTAISDLVLKNNGVVYGCVLTDDLNVIHTRAVNENQRNTMRGSKYVQSDLKDIFKEIKKDLDENFEVLFSGTSCQIAGLKSFLGKSYDKLVCIDIVCHGVPSPKVWRDYINWQEKKNDAKCINVDFRNKEKYGWASHMETLYMNKNGNKINVDSKVFTNLFYSHNILRPACYKCPYKSINHPADITIADYWGIDNAAPNFNDNKGVSLVLINSKEGQNYFNNSACNIEYVECDIEKSMQPPLIKPFEQPSVRNQFWIDYKKLPFSQCVKKYCEPTFVEKCMNFPRRVLRKIKRTLFPK